MSKDKEHIVDFIKNICDKDFAGAGSSMQAAVTEKVKDRIRLHAEAKKDDDDDDEKQGTAKKGAKLKGKLKKGEPA